MSAFRRNSLSVMMFVATLLMGCDNSIKIDAPSTSDSLVPSDVAAQELASACSGGLAIFGTVTDPSGRGFAGISVSVAGIRLPDGTPFQTASDNAPSPGFYCFTHLEQSTKIARAMAKCRESGACAPLKLGVIARKTGVKVVDPITGRRKGLVVVDVAALVAGAAPTYPSAFVTDIRAPHSGVRVDILAGSQSDIGYSGFAHNLDLPANATLKFGLNCLGNRCTLDDLVESSGTGRRCSAELWTSCNSDSDCGPDRGVCGFFLPPMPVELSYPACIVSQIVDGRVSGSFNAFLGNVTLDPIRVQAVAYLESGAEWACPRCVSNAGAAPKCDAGPRLGKPCQVQANTALGNTSLDCPAYSGQSFSVDFTTRPMSNSTPSTLTLTDGSPSCGLGWDNYKCAVGVCSGTQTPCTAQSDCGSGVCLAVMSARPACGQSCVAGSMPNDGVCAGEFNAVCSGSPSIRCDAQYDLCPVYGAGTCAGVAPKSCFYNIDAIADAGLGVGGQAGASLSTSARTEVLDNNDQTTLSIGTTFAVGRSGAQDSVIGLPGPGRIQFELRATLE